MPPLKDLTRAEKKIASEFGGDGTKLTDLSRSTITYSSMDDLYQGLDALNNKGDVVAVLDRFETPKPNGYRDIKVNLKTSNGHTTEMQLHLDQMLEAKELETPIYNQVRDIEGAAKLEGRSLTADELQKLSDLSDESKALYESAFKSAGGG